MTDSNLKFNIFGDSGPEDLRVGYISTDRGYVSSISICEANDYAKLNPGTIFILKNRKQIRYLNINDVNKLTKEDFFTETGDSCEGIDITAATPCTPQLDLFGGGGVGALGNPVIGKDGGVVAIDLVTGGYGYQYKPTARIKDPCGIGAGADLRVSMVGSGDLNVEFIEYDDEEDFEEYEICNKNNVSFGRRFDVKGKDIGEWNPNLYFDGGVLSFDEELKKYQEFLLKAPNPFWTTRSEPPLKITSDNKITRAKYDVYHWAWGAKPGENDPIDNLYIKLFGRRGEPSGMAYWRDRIASGRNLSQIEEEMKTMPEWEEVCEGKCKPVLPDVTVQGGQFFEYDSTNFMNSFAISPVPMSNVRGSDFGGKEHYFEWDVDFPHTGDYIFKFQCDNQGSLYIDGQKKADYKIGSGGAEGNVLSPPVNTKITITKEGVHTVRVDLFNGQVMKKVAEQQKLDDLATSDEVKFDIQLSTMYGASATIEGLDISYEKTFGVGKDVFDSITKKVEYGKVYDVKITSNNKRTGNLPATNKELTFDGLHPANNPINVINQKQLALKDGDGNDTNASFTIDSGNGTFAADGKSIVGTGEQTITLSWNDRRQAGRAINSIKLGNTVWQRTGSGGSVTHTITLGGGVGQLGGANNKAVLRTKGAKVLQMEDIPGTFEGGGGVGNFYDDVVITVDQGRFFDINGLTAKYTLGDRPAGSGVSSTESAGEVITIFNTADFIDKANRELWRTHPVVDKDSSFTNRFGITPKDPTLIYSGSEEGTHTIRWHNVNFPVSGEYDIGIGVDDNVRLIIGDDVNIYKEGFVPGTSISTGTSSYRRFIRAGVYTIIADLEQTAGGRLGFRNIAGDAAGRNPMSLSINIDTVFTEKEVDSKKSWNQNPMGVALSIEAPDPPVPQEPAPIQEGRCPPNPFWSTRFPADQQWFPVSDRRKMYRYAMSPVKPYGEENSSGGGQTYSSTWTVDAPYDGFYKLKAAADDSAVIKLDGDVVLETERLSTVTEKMIQIEEGEHEITVEVSNIAQETFDSIDKRIFTTQGWAAIGTQVEQTLNTNEVDFKFTTSTLFGATASIEGLGISIEKTYGDENLSETFNKKVEFGKIYDVKLTSNTIRTQNTTSTIGGSYPLVYTKLKAGNPRRASNRRLEYDDNPGNGFDVNAAFTIDNVTGGTAKFSADGSSIEVQGDEVKVTLTFNWNDNPRRSGRALESIAIKDTVWRQLNWRARENRWVVESVGSHTYTITLAGKTTSTTSKTIGGANNGAVLRTKGDNVLQMEDIPHVSIEEQKILYDDVIISASQGRFFDINGTNAKYVLDKETKNVMQGGTGSGTVKDGVVYSGPELYHKNYSKWGPFMNKASVSPNPMRDNATTEVVEYSWSNIDFPETGEYDIKFQNDHSATLFLDGKQIASNLFRGQPSTINRGKHSIDMTGMGDFKKVLVEKGKHTLTVKPTVYTEASGGPVGFIDALFKQPVGYKWEENPSGFAIEIRKKMQVVRTDDTGKPVTKSWKDNPVLVSAHLIPPPCPKKVEGVGVVKDIIPIDPGNGYEPPSDPDDGNKYEVILELDEVIIENPGINYDPEDEVVVTGGPGDPVIPPFKPKLGQFGAIIDIPVPPSPTGDGRGWPGFTETPDVSITTSTGIGFEGTPVLKVRRTPVDVVDFDRLLQVTDLVGLKQTGYYDGKPYYGSIFYKDGIKYAGWYETAGQLIQIYDTLQESIDAEVTTPASAIQRQGSDITSNDPRLNIPGTPDNLTY